MAESRHSTTVPARQCIFTKADVMRKAWAIYKDIHAKYENWQFERGIHDGSFSGALKAAWRAMKAAAAEAARKAAEAANPYAAAIAVMRHNIGNLQYKPFGHDIRKERARIEKDIQRLLDLGNVLTATPSIALAR
jgi:hypothetical protein